jgi:hypothetical protein
MNPFIDMFAAPEVPYVLGFVVVEIITLIIFIVRSEK